MIGDVAKKIKDYFVEKITAAGYSNDAGLWECGKAIIVGIFNGIVDWFKNIGTWISNNILKPFKEGWQAATGGSIIDDVVSIGVGLAKDGWKTVQGWFDALGDGVTKGITSIFAWLQKSTAWTTVQAWFNNLGASVIGAITYVKTALQKSTTWTTVQAWFDNLGETITGAATSIMVGLKNGWSTVSAWFSGLPKVITNAVDYEGVSIKLRSTWTSIKTWFQGLDSSLRKRVGYSGVSIYLKNAWTSIKRWFTDLDESYRKQIGYKGVAVYLANAWTSINDWFFSIDKKFRSVVNFSGINMKLARGWDSVQKWFNSLGDKYTKASATIKTVLTSAWSSIQSWFNNMFGNGSTPTVSINTRINSNSRKDARGGTYHGGRHYPFSQAAGGGSFSHGTMILAGEHGAEVAGHINGRTEILNQSQLAAVMYSSVVNGMAAAINVVIGHMTECTNAVIANIAYLVESLDYVAAAMPAYSGINTGFVPDINRTGGVLSGSMSMDALAAAVADRISGNIQIENVMNMDGRAVYHGMVEIDRQTIRQTGRSGFGG